MSLQSILWGAKFLRAAQRAAARAHAQLANRMIARRLNARPGNKHMVCKVAAFLSCLCMRQPYPLFSSMIC